VFLCASAFISDGICESFSVLMKWWAIKTPCPPYAAFKRAEIRFLEKIGFL